MTKLAYLNSRLLADLFGALETGSSAVAQRIRKSRRPAPHRGAGRTLRPGAQTPLWNILVEQSLPFLGKRGSKVRLARFLGLPRQRLHDCLKARHATLDAERTLRLACWVAARQQGRDLSIEVIRPLVT